MKADGLLETTDLPAPDVRRMGRIRPISPSSPTVGIGVGAAGITGTLGVATEGGQINGS
ncbi:MAG: hypothetical protein V3T51_03350 [Gammaproteobacteria bacterium]